MKRRMVGEAARGLDGGSCGPARGRRPRSSERHESKRRPPGRSPWQQSRHLSARGLRVRDQPRSRGNVSEAREGALAHRVLGPRRRRRPPACVAAGSSTGAAGGPKAASSRPISAQAECGRAVSSRPPHPRARASASRGMVRSQEQAKTMRSGCDMTRCDPGPGDALPAMLLPWNGLYWNRPKVGANEQPPATRKTPRAVIQRRRKPGARSISRRSFTAGAPARIGRRLRACLRDRAAGRGGDLRACRPLRPARVRRRAGAGGAARLGAPRLLRRHGGAPRTPSPRIAPPEKAGGIPLAPTRILYDGAADRRACRLGWPEGAAGGRRAGLARLRRPAHRRAADGRRGGARAGFPPRSRRRASPSRRR